MKDKPRYSCRRRYGATGKPPSQRGVRRGGEEEKPDTREEPLPPGRVTPVEPGGRSGGGTRDAHAR
ncbi:hypothetical protein FQA47_021011 [Oryzias melastigma]|uniref:Uncharacterized protein n=1 Tax=Oryzias melastigma TaxID=30732 RepID=A0A834FEG1_ORYME|nr:hypothetical protein FQA47_021011 [Oryzias melastigma]